LKEIPHPSWEAVSIIVVFAVFEAILMLVLPGKTHYGPITPKGNRPTYKLNGVPAFLITHLVLYLGGYHFKWFSPAIAYNHLGEILVTSVYVLFYSFRPFNLPLYHSILSYIVCFLLYFKGIYFPTNSDSG
jgi:7-dehydrocholesterol reductase